jgi:predicted nucleic acid-binding protein
MRSMTDNVFVDTNVYIYAAVETKGEKHGIASDLLSHLSRNNNMPRSGF